MKKITAIILSIIILTSMLSGCTATPSDNGKISIVATIFPQYDFARQIAGEYAEITMLLSPGAETHSYEPTPKDIRKIENCDIFIYTGGESDSWLDDILSSIDTSNIRIISLMDIVEPLEEDDEDSSEHNDGHEYDEHVWTSPVNAIKICEAIADALVAVDSKNSDIYAKNCSDYIEDLAELDNSFKDVVANASKKVLIFGDRFPLLYFAKKYGLEYYSAYPGCSSSTDVNPSKIAELIDKVKEYNIRVVFKIELSNSNIADTISEATGAKVLTFYSCHNISKDDFNNGETYLSLMSKNIESLREALL